MTKDGISVLWWGLNDTRDETINRHTYFILTDLLTRKIPPFFTQVKLTHSSRCVLTHNTRKHSYPQSRFSQCSAAKQTGPCWVGEKLGVAGTPVDASMLCERAHACPHSETVPEQEKLRSNRGPQRSRKTRGQPLRWREPYVGIYDPFQAPADSGGLVSAPAGAAPHEDTAKHA